MNRVNIEPKRQHAVRISNRQYGQLRAILNSPNATAGIEDISAFNQLTLGANKRRGFIAETRRKNGITLTFEGRQVLKAFDQADFMRKVASLNFSSYLRLEPRMIHFAPLERKTAQTAREYQEARRATTAA
ncbi:MAG TPA: hypothetical protein VK789_09405 [Bryobacteraceae bacterium]|jgi:hypothetical protein|nr:hypothetical protein [Bryobacteraceae bacterium]